jgi:hypothetical protein
VIFFVPENRGFMGDKMEITRESKGGKERIMQIISGEDFTKYRIKLVTGTCSC